MIVRLMAGVYIISNWESDCIIRLTEISLDRPMEIVLSKWGMTALDAKPSSISLTRTASRPLLLASASVYNIWNAWVMLLTVYPFIK